jgi:hypothetical protein
VRNVLKKDAERQKKDATAHDLREKSKKRKKRKEKEKTIIA